MAIETLRPTGPGDETGIDTKVPDTLANWNKVCEVVADDATTYVHNSTDNSTWQRDLYAITSVLSKVKINSVTIYVRDRLNNSSVKFCVKTHGVVYEYLSETSPGPWFTESYTWTENPYTGVAWTVAEVLAMQIGVALTGSTDSPDWADVTQVYAEVDYTPLSDASWDFFTWG